MPYNEENFEHSKLIYTEVIEMTNQTKMTLATVETALGGAAMLASMYTNMDDGKKLAVGLAGMALSAHGVITSTKVGNDIFEERLEKSREVIDRYVDAYGTYTRRRWCGF
jgi:hypothetical protein